ncbi:PGF-CTERM sorting domain-containing protein [Methanolacinia paynteri]|uniref:PGF-CTERM sorting domain-containing protein n=1 Tax=Methanolacinia paynteri TaxID=230356 RepID=UPI00064FF67E|nr:PGF-CTERM sorting domain-containing protein [Methanolacinia paynteri]
MNTKNRSIILVFIFFLLASSVSAVVTTKETTTDGDDPWIRITANSYYYTSNQFTISGTTNLPADDNLIVEIVSTSFSTESGSEGKEYSGLSEVVKVVEGDSDNKWSINVDPSGFIPDEYDVRVESVERDSTAATTFELLGEVTASKTPTTTLPPPATTAAPGFGVIISLIALGTAAALFIRRE